MQPDIAWRSQKCQELLHFLLLTNRHWLNWPYNCDLEAPPPLLLTCSTGSTGILQCQSTDASVLHPIFITAWKLLSVSCIGEIWQWNLPMLATQGDSKKKLPTLALHHIQVTKNFFDLCWSNERQQCTSTTQTCKTHPFWDREENSLITRDLWSSKKV